jgi:4-amino-4-deoxy-L-arabinose transferase-like glycosyltransferase
MGPRQSVRVNADAGFAHNHDRSNLALRTIIVFGILAVVFLALYNLTDYPLTWFDEGSHLHVPKTLVRYGVYADYSSEGFRHYGPTLGVGPTVMLPIAGSFSLFGIGLLQARLVMVLYLLAAFYVFYRLAGDLGGRRFAWVALILLVTSRGVGLLLYGRQVLGEVPGLFFLTAGLWVWFKEWERSGWLRLFIVGLLLGLAVITKYQYLLFIAPCLGIAWLANLAYYRIAPHRIFVVPGLVSGACFGFWLAYLVLYLGPAATMDNLVALRRALGGAAMTFSPDLMQQSLEVLLHPSVYLGSLLPALAYGLFISLQRNRGGQKWGILLLLAVINLAWYVLASVGWWRYAFPGMAISGLFVAYFIHDLTDGFRVIPTGLGKSLEQTGTSLRSYGLRWAAMAWLAAMILMPTLQTVVEIMSPQFNAPQAMADFLDENVPPDARIETWEPEMGFLTDHDYHFPPTELLPDAVNYAYLGGPPLKEIYDFQQDGRPAYILVGDFGRWIQIYPSDILMAQYKRVVQIGSYELYQLDN